MGNIKGLQDPYRNPTTQKGFAEKWGQNPSMVTSFADGSKVSFEQAIVANATRMHVARARHVARLRSQGARRRARPSTYDLDDAARAGRHRRLRGRRAARTPASTASPSTPIPSSGIILNLYKLGEGPLYSFYTPWHLCHFEVPNTVARVVLFGDRRRAARRPAGRGVRVRQDGT